MVFYLLASTVLGAVFFLIGFGIAAALDSSPIGIKKIIPTSVLIGFAILLIIFWFKGTFSFIGNTLCIIILLAPMIYSIIRLHKLKSTFVKRKKLFSDYSNVLYSILLGFVMALPMSRGLFTTEVRFRVGPDLLGWGISSRYLQVHNNVGVLISSIKSQTHVQSIETSFQTTDPSTSIYGLASYQEQVSAEFLLASKRIGFQSFIGSVAQIFQSITPIFIIWSLVCLFFTIGSYIVISYISQTKLPSSLKILIVVATLLSPSLVAPIFEGGVWHIIAFTLILYGLFVTLEHKREHKLGILLLPPFLMMSLALTLNSDVLIICIPYLVLWVTQFNRELLRPSLIVFFGFVLLHYPMLAGLARSLGNRSNDAFVGGWSAARLPFPSDVLGLTPWQESDGFLQQNSSFSIWAILLRAFLSLLLILVLLFIEKRYRKIILAYILPVVVFYTYFLFMFYKNINVNTYIPWKLSFVIIPILPFLLDMIYKGYTTVSDAQLSNNPRTKQALLQRQVNRVNRASLVMVSLSLLVLLQFLRVQIDWATFSTTNTIVSKGTSIIYNQKDLDVQEIEKLDISGSCIPWFQSIALVADLRLIAKRSKGIEPKSSSPARASAFLIDPDLKSCEPYKSELLTRNTLYKSQHITLIN
jgi:hypothetical protein